MACICFRYRERQGLLARMVCNLSTPEASLRIFSAKSSQKTLIVPDKDADGLDAGVILLRTLTALGLAPESVGVHLLDKHSTVHDESERQAMQAKDPKYIIVVDHGSIEAPPIVDSPETKCLLIDHHLSDKFPRDAIVGKSNCRCLRRTLILAGRLSLSLPPCCNIVSSDLRNMQSPTSGYSELLWISVCNGYPRRFGQQPQVEAPFP